MHPTRLLSRLGAVIASTSLMLAILTSAIVAGANIGVGAAAAAPSAHASKTAFCSANDAIDKASANVTTDVGFLAVLKTHPSELKVLQENAPSGSLGQLVQQTVQVVDKAIAANNANDLNNLPNGAAIDTYCGVNGNGQPLPAYFNTGKNTDFCATFLPLYESVGNASSKADVLSILLTQKAKISTLASELPKLPSSIRATATAAVNNVEKIIATKNLALLGNGNGPAADLALYCGQNE
jgi:hypothetical protein